MEVLALQDLGQERISEAARDLFSGTVGTEHVAMADGLADNWSILPLQKVLPVLCEEAPAFAQELKRVVYTALREGLGYCMQCVPRYPWHIIY